MYLTHIKRIENPYRNKYVIVATNDNIGSLYEFGGILEKEIPRQGYIFPQINDDYQEIDSILRINYKDILNYKVFSYEKSSDNFCKKYKNFYYDYKYQYVPYLYNYYIYEKDFTGIYDPISKIMIENDMGSHYTSTVILAWIYLIQNVFTEKDLDKYSKEISDVDECFSEYRKAKSLNDFLTNNDFLNKSIGVTGSHFPKIPTEYHEIIDDVIKFRFIYKQKGVQFLESDYNFDRRENYKNHKYWY